MGFNMKQIYANWDFEVDGISTIDAPHDHTILYLSPEEEEKIGNLAGHQYCVIFARDGVLVDRTVALSNFFLTSGDPRGAYEQLLRRLSK